MKNVVTVPKIVLLVVTIVTLISFVSIYPANVPWKPGFASPDTITLRPNAAGTYQEWTIFGGAPAHWQATSDQNDNTGVQSPLWAYKQGTFTANTVTGNQIVNTGSGVVIKALILYGSWQIAEDFEAGESGFLSYIASATQRKCIAWASNDNVATTNTGCGSANAAVLIFSAGTPTQDGLADFVSFGTGADAGKFTISWSDAPSKAFIIHYVALGGDDLTNVFVGQYAAKTGSTGSVSYTGVGFQGDVILFSGISRTSLGTMASSTPWMGAAKSSTARGSIFWGARDARTAAAHSKHWQDTTKCVSMSSATGVAIDAKADFVSFGSDEFTLNWTDYAGSAWLFFVMVLKGGQYDVDTFTAPASTGAQLITTGFQPEGVLFFGTGKTTADATLGSEAHVCIGAMGESPLEEGSIWTSADDTINSDSNKRSVATKCVQVNTNPSTIAAEADATSLNSDGFNITWTTTSSGRRFFSVAFGGSPTVEIEAESFEDASQTGTVNSVTAYIQAKATGSDPVEQTVILWRTYSTDYESSSITISRTAFVDYSQTRTTNPNTGEAWTWTEVNDLQIGSRATALGSGDTIQLSEFWIVVDYTLGFSLNLHVRDWDLSDNIQGAYVYKDADVKTSDANGWANWTLVSGTVQIKVQYYGFWVNGTFSVSIDSDKTIDVQCRLYDVTVLVQEGIQNAYLASANATVYNSTSVQGNKITSGVTGNNGQVQSINLPNNTLTFTQYGGASYSLVIGNATQLVSSENQTITLTADENNVNTNNSYSIIAFVNS